MSGCREVEASEDATLTLGQLDGMNDAAQRRGFLDERANTENAEDALGGQTFVADGCIVGNGLAIKALQEMISRERDLEQIDECLDPLGGFEEQGSDGQRRLPLVMSLFEVALLLELGEERVAAACERRGREQCGITIVVGIGPGGGFIVVEDEALRGSAATALRRR